MTALMLVLVIVLVLVLVRRSMLVLVVVLMLISMLMLLMLADLYCRRCRVQRWCRQRFRNKMNRQSFSVSVLVLVNANGMQAVLILC